MNASSGTNSEKRKVVTVLESPKAVTPGTEIGVTKKEEDLSRSYKTTVKSRSSDEFRQSLVRPSSNIDFYRSKQVQYTDPKPLPERMKRLYQKKHAQNYSEAVKKGRQIRKRSWENKVGWQPRRRHRHVHQAIRQQKLINYQYGLSLDYNPNDSNSCD